MEEGRPSSGVLLGPNIRIKIKEIQPTICFPVNNLNHWPAYAPILVANISNLTSRMLHPKPLDGLLYALTIFSMKIGV